MDVWTRGITDWGVAIGAASALALAVWRVSHGLMSIEALLIVLMAGTEVFRPLRDLRMVLHQGMLGQSAAAGINALLAAEPLVPEQPPGQPPISRPLLPTIAFEDVHFAYPGGRGARRQCARVHLAFAAQLRHDDRRARRVAVGRPTPAPGDRPCAAAGRADPHSRRSAFLGGRGERGGDPAGDRPPVGGTHDPNP